MNLTENQVVSLDPKFESALIGSTVFPDPDKAKLVYSLDRMAHVFIARDSLDADAATSAAAQVAQQVTESCGDDSPLFITEMSYFTPDFKIDVP